MIKIQLLSKTIKLRLYPDILQDQALKNMCKVYRQACNYVSEYIYNNSFDLNSNNLNRSLYHIVRELFQLNSQLTQSVFRTVTARYITVRTQLLQKPYKYKDVNNQWKYEQRTLEWLQKPIKFSRIQADLVRGSNYSFLNDGTILSLTTLNKRTKMSFAKSHFKEYFDNNWTFGTAKLVKLKKIWYLHIPVSKYFEEFSKKNIRHVVGIDRGLRFIVTTYDEQGKTNFTSGKYISYKRHKFQETRRKLQSKNTKSAKRVLKRISGRENRWMSGVNHQISKTLVQRYGKNTLYVFEDLTNIFFNNNNLNKSKEQNYYMRSWSFYQLEQYLTYKAHENQSEVLKVSAKYTSQRCPKCGTINKNNRHHDTHEYICQCGYRSNDDRVGAMNIQLLGTQWISGEDKPSFSKITLPE